MSDTPEAPGKTNPLAYLRERRETHHLTGAKVVPRQYPKGVSVSRISKQEAILYLRCLRPIWWWLAPLIALCFSVPVGFIGIMILLFDDSIFGLVPLLIAIAAAVFGFLYPRVSLPITVQPDAIKVGNQVFDRNYVFGFRVGYTIESDDKTLKNDFLDQSMGFASLRLAYGRWGEDLPYLVNKYHSGEIVIWVNEVIDSVGAPPAKDIDSGKGLRGQIF
ncbi:MAG: hypothetical protein V2I43_24535 [Parvularcula sp.]|jgi:hypothetical protein|nr:hypothetical protein [Parvularcula sp.]